MKNVFYMSLILSSFVCGVHAQTTVVPVAAQDDLTMTIYNQDRALVKDIRAVDFHAGLNQISFENISDQVMPASVLLNATGVQVREQNFNFDLLTRNSLMEKSVGKTVDVEYVNPVTGETIKQTAELLAYSGGQPILKIDNHIEASYPGRVIFKEVPANLAAKPSLVFDVTSDVEGNKKVEVAYLTTGLSWNADYVAELNPDNQLSLNGLVTLTNNTQVSYQNARLQLVAGDVNVVMPRMLRASRTEKMVYGNMAQSLNDSAMESEAIAGYYLYTLKYPTDILSRQTKQVSLLSGQNIQAKKMYEYGSLMDYHSESFFENAKPTMYLSFINSSENGLGEPLPKGVIRVYQKESSGRLIFVGEDVINHTAKNQTVRMALGQDFDITATGKRISYKTIDTKTSSAEFELKISNAKPEPVVVRYKQYLPNGWKIISESLKSQKESSNQIYWDVAVGAESDVVLTFKIEVQRR